MILFRTLAGAVAGIALCVVPVSVQAADAWPARSIEVISPFSAGNANDVVARVVLDEAGRQLGQTFVVENRPGAGGAVGAGEAARADPDGYTVLLNSSSLASQVVLHKSLPFDPVRDFTPVSMFGIQPSVLVATPSRGWKSVADLVAAARAKPGALNFASAGIGSASHMAAERLRLAAGIEVQHIPFRGPVEAFSEVIAGRVDFYYLPIAPALTNISNGKVVALAVSTPKRAVALPDVPTVAEAGYPGAEYLFWGGVAVPARTSRAIVDRLHEAVDKALATPAVVQRLATLGVQPTPMSVEDFAKFVREDVDATIKLAKDIHLEPTN